MVKKQAPNPFKRVPEISSEESERSEREESEDEDVDDKVKALLIGRKKPLNLNRKKEEEEEKLAEASNINMGRSEQEAPELSIMSSVLKRDGEIPSKRGSILLPETAKQQTFK